MIHNVYKKKKTNGLTIILSSCWIIVLIVSISEITNSVAQDQTAIPLPKHTYPYLIGAKNGLAAAKVGRYDVGEACTPFTYNRTSTANDLNHCIAGYYDAVAGYHDAKVAIHDMKQGNANMAGEVNITRNNTTNANGSKGS